MKKKYSKSLQKLIIYFRPFLLLTHHHKNKCIPITCCLFCYCYRNCGKKLFREVFFLTNLMFYIFYFIVEIILLFENPSYLTLYITISCSCGVVNMCERASDVCMCIKKKFRMKKKNDNFL